MALSNKVKVGYWAFQGSGQIVKYALEYVGLPYEQVHYFSGEQWAEKKNSGFMDFPNLPYLEDGDKKITESLAILTHIANKSGKTEILGKTDDEKVKVLNLFGVLYDARLTAARICFSKPENLEATKQQFLEPSILPKCKLLDKFLGDRDTFIGYITIADIYLYHFISFLNVLGKDLINQFPNIKRFGETFEKQQWLVDYKKSDRFIPFLFGSGASLGATPAETLQEFFAKQKKD